MLTQKTIYIIALVIFCLVSIFPDKVLASQISAIGGSHNFVYEPIKIDDIAAIYNSFLIQQSNPDTWGILYYSRIAKRKTVMMTAYSSTPDQTDSTPFITASGTRVRDGIVAANFLPFGAKIKIPQLFGDKVFVVEDRMNKRYTERVDIWFSTRRDARQFGIKKAEIVVLY